MPGTDAVQFIPLSYGDPVPESFFDAAQEVLGTLGRLDLIVQSSTVIRALCGVGADECGIGVGGALRFRTTNCDRAMPGGAVAGRYDIYVTTGATTFVDGGPPTDTTDYSWTLAIVTSGGAAPATAYAKKVGYLDFDGAVIYRLVQTFMRRDDAPHAAVSTKNKVSALEAIMPGAATAAAIRAQVGATEVFHVAPDGSVMATGTYAGVGLTLSGARGSLALTAADGGVIAGGDTEWYRAGPNLWGSPDSAMLSGYVQANANAFVGGNLSLGPTGGGGPWDAIFSRTAAGVATVNSTLIALNALGVGGTPLEVFHGQHNGSAGVLLTRLDGGVNLKHGRMLWDGSQLAIQTLTDALAPTTVLTAGRTGIGFFGTAARPQRTYTAANYAFIGAHRTSFDRADFSLGDLADLVLALLHDLGSNSGHGLVVTAF